MIAPNLEKSSRQNVPAPNSPCARRGLRHNGPAPERPRHIGRAKSVAPERPRPVEGLHDLMEDHKKILTIVEKGTNTIVGTKSATTKEAQPDSFEEQLIKYVQDRPALYKIALPLSERTTGKKNALWLEIFNLFGGRYTVEDLQKKWKYLRDCFIRARKKVTQYIPSGSGALASTDPGFRHYDLMKFVDDGASSLKRTICSVPEVLTSAPEVLTSAGPSRSVSVATSSRVSTPMTSPAEDLLSPTPTSIRRKTNPKKDLEKHIVEALSTPTTLDGVDGFLLRLGESLRRLPYRERSRLEIKIMELVYDTETLD